MQVRFLYLLCVALWIGGCDTTDPAPDPDPVISGTYTGAFSQSGGTIDVTLIATETAMGEVSGSVTFAVAGIPLGLTVAGTHSFPDFSLRFQASGFDDIVYSGTTSSSGLSLEGEMNGSGFVDVNLTLAR